jgi:hypothetical protein
MPAFALAGGSLIFVIFVVVFFVALCLGYYTVRGSGINLRAYRRADGPPESPPQLAHDIIGADVKDWQRGTEGHHGRHRPPATQQPADPVIAAALSEWRASAREPETLEPPIGPNDHVDGPDGAPTIAMYVDLASESGRSACRLVDQMAKERPLRIAIRHLPLADVHPLALPAAEALEAAAGQGRFFGVLYRLAGGGFTDEAGLLDLASALVPDGDRLRAEVRDGSHRARIAEHIRQAIASGARTIPEVYLDGSHYQGDIRPEYLRRAVAAVDHAAG